MFTGLIVDKAKVCKTQLMGADSTALSLQIESSHPQAAQQELGASVALNGACMTVVSKEVSFDSKKTQLSFEVSPESLVKTNLGKLKVDSPVHVEFALKMGDPLGGHLVSGHVDGMAKVLKVSTVNNDFYKVLFSLEEQSRLQIGPYLVEKGSVAVDGVSLTVNGVYEENSASGHLNTLFDVMLIPHTLNHTFFRDLEPGFHVNVEADLMAKYAARFAHYHK